jgi:hypothetical protein
MNALVTPCATPGLDNDPGPESANQRVAATREVRVPIVPRVDPDIAPMLRGRRNMGFQPGEPRLVQGRTDALPVRLRHGRHEVGPCVRAVDGPSLPPGLHPPRDDGTQPIRKLAGIASQYAQQGRCPIQHRAVHATASAMIRHSSSDH